MDCRIPRGLRSSNLEVGSVRNSCSGSSADEFRAQSCPERDDPAGRVLSYSSAITAIL